MIEPAQGEDPAAREEVGAAFARYEAALMANDVAVLDELFLVDARTIRYGIGENLYGFDAIARFRQDRPGAPPQRTVLRTAIACFGRDVATTHIEFRVAGGRRIGRQSQSWIRTAQGWRIVAAHVSLMDGSS